MARAVQRRGAGGGAVELGAAHRDALDGRAADRLHSSPADSTVLAHIMTLLNERYDYGLDLCLLSIDEGISGYRDASLDVRDLSCSFCKLVLTHCYS